MERQAFLAEPNAPTLWAVVDETVLRRSVGGSKIMHEALGYMLEVADHPKITFQVLPFDTGAPAGLTCSFILLTLRNGVTVAFAEDLTGGRFVE